MNIFLNADVYSELGLKLESENLQCFLNNSLHKSVPFLDMYQLTKVCPKGDTSRSELKLTKSPFTPGHFVPAISLSGAGKELCTGPAGRSAVLGARQRPLGLDTFLGSTVPSPVPLQAAVNSQNNVILFKSRKKGIPELHRPHFFSDKILEVN